MASVADALARLAAARASLTLLEADRTTSEADLWAPDTASRADDKDAWSSSTERASSMDMESALSVASARALLREMMVTSAALSQRRRCDLSWVVSGHDDAIVNVGVGADAAGTVCCRAWAVMGRPGATDWEEGQCRQRWGGSKLAPATATDALAAA